MSCLGLPDVQATFTVVRNAPGLFQGEHSLAVATHEDGSPVTADAPAKSGELLTFYGTGFGPAERGRPFGFAPSTASADARCGDGAGGRHCDCGRSASPSPAGSASTLSSSGCQR